MPELPPKWSVPAPGTPEQTSSLEDRAIRALLRDLNALRIVLRQREDYVITQEAVNAWWLDVTPREWIEARTLVAWFYEQYEPFMRFLSVEVLRGQHLPPYVEEEQGDSDTMKAMREYMWEEWGPEAYRPKRRRTKS